MKISVKKTIDVILHNENNDYIAKVTIITDIDKETKVSLPIQIPQSCIIEIHEGLYEKNGKTVEANIVTHY